MRTDGIPVSTPDSRLRFLHARQASHRFRFPSALVRHLERVRPRHAVSPLGMGRNVVAALRLRRIRQARDATTNCFVLAVWSDEGTPARLRSVVSACRPQRRTCACIFSATAKCAAIISAFCAQRARKKSSRERLPNWLSAPPADESHRWDRLELSGVDATDVAVGRLLEHLQSHGNMVHHCPTFNGWRVALPATWDEYLMILSKPHRNRLRRTYRNYFETGRVIVRHAHSPDEIAQAFAILIQLHQGRWKFRGQPGCFASRTFESFHREVSLATDE